MQPDPPEMPDNSPDLPKRSRPANHSQVSDELDLWDFDEDLLKPSNWVKNPPVTGFSIPPAPLTGERNKLSVSLPRESSSSSADVTWRLEPTQKKVHSPLQIRERKRSPLTTEEFELELNDDAKESWEDLDTPAKETPKTSRVSLGKEPQPITTASQYQPSPPLDKPPAAKPPIEISTPAKPELPSTIQETTPAPDASGTKLEAEAIESLPSEEPEFEILEPKPAPPDAPLIPRVHLNLTGFERLALIALAILVTVGAIYGVFHFFRDIPTQKIGYLVPKFPLNGKLLTVQQANTYWREPVRNGPEADKTRRETRLIPILEVTLSGSGSGALRVLFHDDQGTVVGDPINYQANNGRWTDSGQVTQRFSSTAGFDDNGMYAAYRTGGTKTWRAEILEGPSVDADRNQFKKLCDVPISIERR